MTAALLKCRPMGGKKSGTSQMIKLRFVQRPRCWWGLPKHSGVGGWGTAHATTGRVLKRGLSACMLIMYPVKKERQGFVLILHCWPHRGIIRLASLSVSHLRWAATSLYAPIHSAQCFRRRDTGLYRSAAASPSSTSIFSA